MKAHTKLYLLYFQLDESDFIECEMCGNKAVDIHHISSRKMGGQKDKDTIENLMALCRDCHVKFGDKRQYVNLLKKIHNDKISRIYNSTS